MYWFVQLFSAQPMIYLLLEKYPALLDTVQCMDVPNASKPSQLLVLVTSQIILGLIAHCGKCDQRSLIISTHKLISIVKQHSNKREYGCRYSVLLELPYYEVIRMCVIDPMHNLLLGTAKHMVSVWRSCGIILDKDLESIQHAVDSFTTPSDIGRIPTRISSGFSGFTADQWRNWTLLYSLCSLKRLLPQRDNVCWQKFVKSFAAGLYPYNR